MVDWEARRRVARCETSRLRARSGNGAKGDRRCQQAAQRELPEKVIAGLALG